MDNVPPEEAIIIGFLIGQFLFTTYRCDKAMDLYFECLVLLNQLPVSLIVKTLEHDIRSGLSKIGSFIFERGLECYGFGKIKESVKHFEKALFIHKQIGCRSGEAWSHCRLGRSLFITCQYDRAVEHYEKALGIREITGYDRQRLDGRLYNNIGEVHHVRAKYEEARRYYEKALAISIKIRCEKEQAVSYNNLGVLNHDCIGKLDDALVFHEKALEIRKRLRHRNEEGFSYNNIGGVFEARGEYQKALEYYEKSLAVSKEVKDRQLEGRNLYFIGKVYGILGQYKKAIEHQERALKIKSEIGERKAGVLTDLGCLYMALGEYDKAIEYNKQGIKLCDEIGDIDCKGTCYNNMSQIYVSLGEHAKAIEYLEKSICILQPTGVKVGLAKIYSNIASVYTAIGLYHKSRECLENALKLSKETGDVQGEAACMLSLGSLYLDLGKRKKAIECGEKALEIATEIGERKKEMEAYTFLGGIQFAQGNNEKAIEFQREALEMMKEIGIRNQQQFIILENLGLAYASHGDLSKACDFLLEGIKNHQRTRAFFEDESNKLLLDGRDFSCYKTLSWLLLHQGKVNDALFTLELGRGRALVDLIAKKYGIQEARGTKEATSSALQSLFKNQNRNFLFIAMLAINIIALWFVDRRGNIKFKQVKIPMKMGPSQDENVKDEFVVDASRSVLNDLDVQCEDRSLSALYDDGPSATVEQKIEKPKKHVVRKGGEGKQNNQSNLQHACKVYSVFIAPIVDLIDSPEIIIVPEGPVFQTPFASLKDENGKYLSERVRIRLIPSLTTLKLILDAPRKYHCQTGALIVGDPQVGRVEFKGKMKELSPLPKAREEAKMVARLLGVSCLVGEHATKEEVLRKIQEVSLVHIAAHGDAERGEIALAPNSSVIGTPKKDDFMLTMKDIAEVGIRAKLVVLSCCDSASGKILKAEGVVGIARAFLGSGARSVLMSLWKVDDDATKAFMNIFYKCLIREKLSASEALHQAMKKMRESLLYNDVKHWAPFVLLGDDVSLDGDITQKDDVRMKSHRKHIENGCR
ncbi:uncharacterized protein LOC144630758 [Oculina patagonica]